jgi:hypothetical protein
MIPLPVSSTYHFSVAKAPHKLKIKLEIGTQPPEGSDFEYRYLDCPLDFELCTQTLSSNFSLKIHALLCRSYIKGRDWFDFGWYVTQDVTSFLPPAFQQSLKLWSRQFFAEKLATLMKTESFKLPFLNSPGHVPPHPTQNTLKSRKLHDLVKQSLRKKIILRATCQDRLSIWWWYCLLC